LRCGLPMPETSMTRQCGHCIDHSPPQIETHSLFTYEKAVRAAILGWKLQQNDAAIDWLVCVSGSRLSMLIQPEDMLVAVPMPLQRMRQTGIHHAADLCRKMAVQVGCAWEWQLLERKGYQPRQSRLRARERKKNLCHAFALNDDYGHRVQAYVQQSGGRIWLVDDIITTGATIAASAKVLQARGMDVYAFSLARTLKKP